jgi:hypothetical protein
MQEMFAASAHDAVERYFGMIVTWHFQLQTSSSLSSAYESGSQVEAEG